jgi:mannose-6-phosphate isomerase-like protein (cupin superfamily)
MKRYHEVNFASLAPIECCCGTTRRAFVEVADAPASAHYLDTKEEAASHYHRKTTEIYLVIEGSGYLELDGEMVAVRPLSAVMIQPGCRHRVVGKMKIINVPVPKHDEADFFFDEPATEPGGVAAH